MEVLVLCLVLAAGVLAVMMSIAWDRLGKLERRADAAGSRVAGLAAEVARLKVWADAADASVAIENTAPRVADLEKWRTDHETRLRHLEGLAAAEMVLIAMSKADAERALRMLDEDRPDVG